MMEEKLTQELQAFDFSDCHPVKERLLDKLLQMHRADNAGRSRKGKWAASRLDDMELDFVAAAAAGEGAEGKLPKEEETWKGIH